MISSVIICALYLLILLIFSKIFGVKYTEIIKSNNNIKKGIIYPVGLSAILLIIFAYYFDWLPDVLSFSPKVNQLFLWLIPAITILSIIARFILINPKAFQKNGLILLSAGTLLVGFSEELLVRGIAVSALQNAGYSVLVAGIASSVIFGLLHFMNYFMGQDIKKTSIQVASTVLMGLNFYIIYVISGSLWFPIILHFLYDFSILGMGPNPDLSNKKLASFIAATTIGMFVLPVFGLFFLI